MTITVVTSALELGFIYSLVALALFLSFRILNIADMTTDGSFTLGCAVSATVAVAGHPWLALPAAMLAGAAAVVIVLFLNTRLGLSIRATGDNPDMVRASSINTGFTITVGLCISNALTALSGAVLAQYQKTADINLGTGMVIIGLASLIIGETIFRSRSLWLKALGALVGCIVYRFIIAIALRLDIPSECLKLVSAVIVALAIALPNIKKKGAR